MNTDETEICEYIASRMNATSADGTQVTAADVYNDAERWLERRYCPCTRISKQEFYNASNAERTNMKYQKINTLWKRAEIGNKVGRIIEGDVSNDEFKEIKKWDVTEKIDGMNIRVNFNNNIVTFDGRTDNAQIPTKLYKELQTVFTFDRMQEIFGTTSDVTLFGEGYGPNINGGGAYRDTPGFILFDVLIGKWWLLRNDVDDIANKLGIKSVPYIGYMNTDSIIKFVKSNPNSRESNKPKSMEGVVCRTKSMLLSRDGTPLMWKLKCKDYR